MILILKGNAREDAIKALISRLQEEHIEVQRALWQGRCCLFLSGDCSSLDSERLAALGFVESVKRLQTPYQKAGRALHPEDTVISLGSTEIGGGSLTLIAGPCSVESEAQVVAIARAVKAAGATLLRGGAFKPRTSPYAFQGLGERGLAYLKIAKEETGLPLVSEIMDQSQLPLFQDVDILQVGARNMQNFALLKALGRQEKPVLLKRGLSATYEEFLMSAEYLLKEGNPRVILCERGIRSFEPSVRNTLDITAVPMLQKLSHLPLIVDPSHAGGKSELVPPLAKAAVAAGCDGLLIEVHNAPAQARSDGAQALDPQEFSKLCRSLRRLHSLLQEEE